MSRINRLAISLHRRCRRNNQSGMSLLTVVALGTVVMLWIYGMSSMVLPSFTTAADAKFQTVVRAAAEAGLDYAVDQLTQSISNDAITSSLDDGMAHTVPSDAIGNNGATVTITVKNVAPPNNSGIYQQAYAVPTTAPTINTSSGVSVQGWRTVTATANYAGFKKTIRVVLQPQFNMDVSSQGITTTSTSTTPVTTTTTTTTLAPYFLFAAFGQSWVVMNGSGRNGTDGYNSNNGAYGGANVDPKGGNVGTNAGSYSGTTWSNTPSHSNGGNSGTTSDPIYLAGGTVGGNLSVDSLPVGSTTYATVGSSGATITGNVVTNGVMDPANTGLTIDGTRQLSQSSAQISVPAPLTYSSSATIINASYSTSGSNQSVIAPTSGQVVNLGTVSVTKGTLTIPPGDYEINSLSVTGNGTIAIGSGGPVRLFFQGNSSGNVVNIAGNGISNPGVPADLQMWYSGSHSVSIGGNGNLSAVVYAPNSAISVHGNGDVFGALFGYSVSGTGNGKIHFDEALGQTANNLNTNYLQSTSVTTSVNQTNTTTSTTYVPYSPLVGLRTVSWQEF